MESPIKMDDLGGKPHHFWKHPNGPNGFSLFDFFTFPFSSGVSTLNLDWETPSPCWFGFRKQEGSLTNMGKAICLTENFKGGNF